VSISEKAVFSRIVLTRRTLYLRMSGQEAKEILREKGLI